jgi:hypothetical protein
LRTSRSFLNGDADMAGWNEALGGVSLEGVDRDLDARTFLAEWLYVLEARRNPAWRALTFFHRPRRFAGAREFYSALADRTGVPDIEKRVTGFGDVDRLRGLIAAVDASERRLIEAPLDETDHWICDTVLRLDFACDGTARLYTGYIDLLKHEAIEGAMGLIQDRAARRWLENEIIGVEEAAA